MRLLFAIPHYFGPGPAAFGSSDTGRRSARAAALRACISALHQQFGANQSVRLHDGSGRTANGRLGHSVDVVVCVQGQAHLLAELGLAGGTYRVHQAGTADPRYLGYACYDVLREACGSYDWYCFLEDDIVIRDPLFFAKLESFYAVTGSARYLLLPQRFELSETPLPGKVYIDGPLWADGAEFLASLRLPDCKAEIQVPFGGAAYRMSPAENPHAGCFFLTETHLQHLLEQPWYGTPVVGYAGPLESAATMSIMALFHIFKPADEAAAFLEVHHAYQKFAGAEVGNAPASTDGSSGDTASSLWLDDLQQPGRPQLHASWFRDDTVDYWRHQRMYEGVFKCLSHACDERWLTIGDGRYGLDAIRMTRNGFSDVTASDLDASLLQLSHDAGLIKAAHAENAERLSFGDSSFDYVLCKESYHHFNRPMVALYEMLRVAAKGVVLIEPQDPYIDLPVYGRPHQHLFEDAGNYIYTLSRRELEKVALGMRLPAVAFKNICDLTAPDAEMQPAVVTNPVFTDLVERVAALEQRCSKGEEKYSLLLAVLFVTAPSALTISSFEQQGWFLERF